MLDYSSIYVYVCHVNTLRCIHENYNFLIYKFLNYLNLEQAYEGNNMMQSPYLVDRDVLYIGYVSVIGTSIADMNLSDVMVIKAKVPLN